MDGAVLESVGHLFVLFDFEINDLSAEGGPYFKWDTQTHPLGKTLALCNEEAERIFIPLPCVCACACVPACDCNGERASKLLNPF